MRAAIEAMQTLLRGEHAVVSGPGHSHPVGAPPVPVYVAAEGPKTLELAGEVADGVIFGLGLEHLRRGAERAGSSLEDPDIWAMARINVGEDRDALIRDMRMELASAAHHAFRFTLAGKQVPPAFHDACHGRPPHRRGDASQGHAAGRGAGGGAGKRPPPVWLRQV